MKTPKNNNDDKKKTLALLLAFLAMASFLLPSDREKEIQFPYSEFLERVNDGSISSVLIEGSEITATTIDGDQKKTTNPGDLGLIGDLIDSNVEIVTKPRESDTLLGSILRSILPMVILILGILYITRSQSGGGGIFGLGKSKAKMQSTASEDITLDSVAGASEAKEEIEEIVDFLSSPKKYLDMGSKIPRGVLLTGPPGTGKTLIAKGVAGSAKVPFYYTSGSDFVEMFVGVGASRVRDMFDQAKKTAPSIIFIDEIDAIGGKRGSSAGGGGNEEREQTLNQMLVEMDGFEGSSGVIVMAATNRPETLDRALLRPGRFDRQITVGLPDLKEREEILEVHRKNVKFNKKNDLKSIARGTPGFSGADLANLINEASLLAAKNNKKEITQEELEKAKDKIMMGSERKSMKMDDKDRMMTAYHEAGHAIVGRLIGNHDPVYKVSILPRGRALGITMFLPEKDKYSVSFDELNASIASLYGGRIAEEMKYGVGGISTGASNDIERATKIARDMVTKWGFSAELKAINYETRPNEYGVVGTDVSKRTAEVIDEEVKNIISKNYQRALDILSDNKDILEDMANMLMEKETIDEDEISKLLEKNAQ